MTGRRGFALLAVLWVTVALGSLVAGAAAHARAGQDGANARTLWFKARWAAEGCLAASHAALEAALRAGEPFERAASDTIAFANSTACTVDALDPSARLHADSAPASQLARLDSVLRAEGRDPALHRDAYLTRDGDGRVNLNTAPPEVLLTLPGMSAAAVRIVARERAWDRSFADIGGLLAQLSPGERDALLARLPELLPLITFRTGALVLRAEGWHTGGRSVAVVEEVVVPAGPRVATVQRRLW